MYMKYLAFSVVHIEQSYGDYDLHVLSTPLMTEGY